MKKNVNVCLIEAGIVHTKFFDNIKITELSSESEYAKDTLKMVTRLKKIINSQKWTMPEEVAKKYSPISTRFRHNHKIFFWLSRKVTFCKDWYMILTGIQIQVF